MNQKGFTLIELLATIAVIGVVALGIASLFYNIQFVQRESNYLDRATRAAQKEVEVLRNNSYNALTVGEDINFSNDLPDELPNGSTGTVVVTEPSPGLKRVDVTVSYNDGNKPQSVTLSSMIGVIGLSQ
ncbi:type II secretion system protein [Candidatus Saccharibacteria bacterium]|nr:type II secretion system protein [Candidatus Saccharibacteria bacterium]